MNIQRVEFLRRGSDFTISGKYLGRFWFIFKVFRQFWWFWRSGRGFLIRNDVEIIPKYGLEVDFWTFWEAIICATTFLLVNDVFKTNESKRLRWPPIDLRRGVHLKHQNLISKFEKIEKQICRVPDYFTLCLPKSILTVNMHRECVRKTSFEKCCTTH